MGSDGDYYGVVDPGWTRRQFEGHVGWHEKNFGGV